MDYKKIFSEIDVLDKSNIKTINIDNNAIFTYLFNSPTNTINISPIPIDSILYNQNIDETLYVIPREGDILLSIEISGFFSSSIELFQYDWTGIKRIIFDNAIGINGIDNKIILQPFIQSGFPLLQMGKNLYLIIKKPNDNCKVKATFAFLDSNSRRELATYKDHNINLHDAGVKILHNNNKLYQVFGLNDHGFSPNYLDVII